METVLVDGVALTLARPDRTPADWVDYDRLLPRLHAAWLRLSDEDPPLSPRIVGAPGQGKTTLAMAAARALDLEVYVFACNADTRPEDLVVTPVLASEGKVEYRASAIVSAMLRGGVALLDEANRMPERCWAALAPLLDQRRYVDSIAAGVRIHAHADFRLCTTMNDDASVYSIPAYALSRLSPRIPVGAPPRKVREEIVRRRCDGLEPALLEGVLAELQRHAEAPSATVSVRDAITLAAYARRMKKEGAVDHLRIAAEHVLGKRDV